MTLRTENLTVCYGTNKILDGVSLALPAGKTTALLGPNGCGKSTLLNCFSRLLAPQSGGVFLGDNAINTLSSRQLARRLALLPQHHLTPEGITVQELVSYGRNPWLSLWGRLSVECAGPRCYAPDPDPTSCRPTVNRSFRRSAPARLSGDGPGPEYTRHTTR